MQNTNAKNLIFTGVAVVVLLAIIFLLPKDAPGSKLSNLGPEMDRFAQCLNDTGAIEYGAYWCGACEDQKKAFGESFKYINYVECSDEAERCRIDGIEYTPTWVFADGEKLIGVQPLSVLAEKTGCELPNSEN